jgi:hypothetical protein
MDEGFLLKALLDMPEDEILVLENIDRLCDNEITGRGLTINQLLSVLEHVHLGQVIFMTATDFKRLESVAPKIRRVDHLVHFSYATKECITEMFIKFLPNQMVNIYQFQQLIAKQNVTGALLEKFFFTHRKCENILEKKDDLFRMIGLYAENNSNMFG